MKKRYPLLLVAIMLISLGCTHSNSKSEPSTKPNIIYILADDLGYGELGAYGQQLIETPNIDALAAGGMKFTQHYSGAPVCAPARCILLTGKHAGNAFVRGNDEWGERGKTWDYQKMFDDPNLEGQRPLPPEEITIAEVLKEAGYATGMIGKWGLGAPLTEGLPNKQGFDFFYGYNCQRQAHTYYPMHLWRNEERVLLNNKFVNLHSNFPKDADPNDPKNYEDFTLNDYAPTLMHNEALGFISANQEHPFFLYYASPIPHLPLQAPARWVEYYKEKFGAEEPFIGNAYYPNQTPKATYAAMISYLDEQVGELVQHLKDLGEYENTLIIFSSDNGPTYVGGVDAVGFNSAGPFREGSGLVKGSVNEGGIRIPMIAHWPDKIQANTTSAHPSAFYDVFATLSEVANVDSAPPTDGISFLPSLLGQAQKEHEYLYWEFPAYTGQQAIRKGRWKAIRKNILQGNLEIELYNLEEDLQELNNVAAKYPEMVEEMKQLMATAHTEPQLDAFKMEALGDVKTAYLDSRDRANKWFEKNCFGCELKDGYFKLNKQTKIEIDGKAQAAIDILQAKLRNTGGFQLQANKKRSNNLLILNYTNKVALGAFKLNITPEAITVGASNEEGFTNAINSILDLMDPTIDGSIEMHNPNWHIASLTANSTSKRRIRI